MTRSAPAVRRGVALCGLYVLALAAGCHLIGGAGDLTFSDASGKLSNGTDCTSSEDCASAFCVDGVCCDAACDGDCERCDLEAALGTCTPEPVCGVFRLEEMFFAGTDNDDDRVGEGLLRTDGTAYLGFRTGNDAPIRFGDFNTNAGTLFTGVLGQVGADGGLNYETYGSASGGTFVNLPWVGFTQLVDNPSGFVASGVIAGVADFGNDPIDLGANGSTVVVMYSEFRGDPVFREVLPAVAGNVPLVRDMAATSTDIAIAYGRPDPGAAGVRTATIDFFGVSSATFDTGLRRGWSLGAEENLDLDASVGGGIEALAFDPDGTLWAVGWYTAEASFDGGSFPTEPAMEVKPAVVRYENPLSTAAPQGKLVSIGGASTSARITAVTSGADTVYVGGATKQTLTFQGVSGEVTIEADGGGEHPFVVAFDLSDPPRARWGFSVEASSATKARVTSIAARPSGGVVIGGELTGGTVTFATNQSVSAPGPGERAGFVLAYEDGATEWVQTVSGQGRGRVTWVDVAADGRVWAAGEGAGAIFERSPSPLGADNLNAFLARFGP